MPTRSLLPAALALLASALLTPSLAGCAVLDPDRAGSDRHREQLARPADAVPAPATGDQPLVFAFFRNPSPNQEQDQPQAPGLSLATSRDGLAWDEVPGGPVFTPRVSVGGGEAFGVRDPAIARGPDGVYHMVFTWQGDVAAPEVATGIGYASSRDLRTWSDARNLQVMRPYVGRVPYCWAPDLVFDPARGEWLITWAAPVQGMWPETAEVPSNTRLWATRTRDFVTLSEPVVYLEPGYPVIDGAIVPLPEGHPRGRWAMFAKDERNRPVNKKQIKVTFADSLEGPWRWTDTEFAGVRTGVLSPAITTRGVEGPAPFRAGEGWLVLYDVYPAGRHGALWTTDFEQFTDVSARTTFPPQSRHGSVVRVDEDTWRALRERR